MKVYKLTDENMKTGNGFQWKLGEKKTASGEGKLCSKGWLHFYLTKELAVLLNPLHASIKNPRIFEADADGIILMDSQLKGGTTSLSLTKEIDLPKISLTQTVAFCILCTKQVCKEEKWTLWANNWLNNLDRTYDAAYYAAEAAVAAADAAANAADAAANATAVAVAAADEAVAAATAASANAAAYASSYSYYSVTAAFTYAANSAVAAVAYAAASDALNAAADDAYANLDLISISLQCLKY